MTQKNYSEAEIETMRVAVAAADRKLAEAAQAKRDAYLAPVRDLIASEAWHEVWSKLAAIRSNYDADNNYSIHINALHEIMPRLEMSIPPLPTPVGDPVATESDTKA